MSQIHAVAVIGAGVIGRGVAQSLAETGHKVILIDRSDAQLTAALREIEKTMRLSGLLSGSRSRTSAETLLRIQTETSLSRAAAAHFVIENVTEDWDVKQAVHRELDGICDPDVVVGMNTSAIPITRLASIGRRKECVVGIHFMNPVPLMPMVEVIRGVHTSDQTVEKAKQLIGQMGKECIVVRDSPGFVTNRVMMLTVNEAIFLVEEGVASPEEIDRLFKTCFGHKMGPLETADLIGLDTVLRSIEVIYDNFRDGKYRPCPLLCRMVEADLLGRKSGEGFYKYS